MTKPEMLQKLEDAQSSANDLQKILSRAIHDLRHDGNKPRDDLHWASVHANDAKTRIDEVDNAIVEQDHEENNQ